MWALWKEIFRGSVPTRFSASCQPPAVLPRAQPNGVRIHALHSPCVSCMSLPSLVDVAAQCRRHGLFHVVNNAYGIQSGRIAQDLRDAAAEPNGIHVFIQSTDKNLMVPVGGTIVGGFDSALVDEIGRTYPGAQACNPIFVHSSARSRSHSGRASGSPVLDAFITLLSMGRNGYKDLLKSRKVSLKTRNRR
jgi:O-phospho-L-seryl-tRNASec:L-selenocysteinyl-tRNA synthase